MRVLVIAGTIVLVCLFAVSTSFATQCILNCPAGDGGVVGPGAGSKSPDLNSDGLVNLVDLAAFAAAWPPNPYDFCVDYNCDGIVNLADLSLFAIHWGHAGPFPGFCQPGVDHYKTYQVVGPSINGPIFLEDQFGFVDIPLLTMTKFATPVRKNGQAYCDSIAHQTWWEFLFPQPPRIIIAKDQFGESEWFLGDSRYLLNPALKFAPPGTPLPIQNHYLCYEAIAGPQYAIPVVLEDQFGVEQVIVVQAKLFCNPAKKTTPDGITYPIIDDIAHLTCYFVDNPIPHQYPVRVDDQFVDAIPLVLDQNDCLCLPAQKLAVVEPNTSEWDRIKALFDTR